MLQREARSARTAAKQYTWKAVGAEMDWAKLKREILRAAGESSAKSAKQLSDMVGNKSAEKLRSLYDEKDTGIHDAFLRSINVLRDDKEALEARIPEASAGASCE